MVAAQDAASAAAGSFPLDVAGERLALLPEKAIWWPARRALLVADVHVGKAQSFRKLGVAVPRGTTDDTLGRLSLLVERHAVRRLFFLGDFLHARAAHAPATVGALARWRRAHAALELTLVRGNHDARAGDPPPVLGIEPVDEPLVVGGLALAHHPQPRPGAYVLAGHLHPCCHVGGRAHDHVRLPCFHFGEGVGVLPAFGAFTGMHPVRAQAGDRLFAVVEDRVVELPPAG